ncbi:3-phosphoshikimate 1-carboxyvinyltransferase [Aerococcaceae bacterium WGS1372]
MSELKLKTAAFGIHREMTVPGDKSISHRAVMLGSIAEGITTITGLLRADDCLPTIEIMRQLGVDIIEDGDRLIIHGRGLQGLRQSNEPLDAGNSGTTMRLLSGILVAQNFSSTLIGDESLSCRPMDRIVNPLKLMGADIEGLGERHLPELIIKPVNKLHGIDYEMPVASAQVKSSILLAGLQTEGVTRIIEKEKSRNHTEEMLEQFGAQIKINGNEITLKGKQQLTGQTIDVPGDISSAAFFIAAGLLVGNSQIVLKNIGYNYTRSGILDVIQAMNANVSTTINNNGYSADIAVQSSNLHPTVIEGDIIPRLIDEIPIIALLATQAAGTTIIKDAQELRVKETDRLTAVAENLNKMGANIIETVDGLIIHGPTQLHGASVDSYDDHRIAMMLQIAALLVKNNDEVKLNNAECVNISYPGFFEVVNQL